MSHPSPELIVEVNIFERLEQVTNLTLGQLTRLRQLSRERQVNLLFTAFQESLITGLQGHTIAHELGISSARAPWKYHEHSSQWAHQVRDDQGQSSMGQGSMGQGSMGQGSMGQGSMGQSSMGQGSMGQGSMGQARRGYAPNGSSDGWSVSPSNVLSSSEVQSSSSSSFMGASSGIDRPKRRFKDRASLTAAIDQAVTSIPPQPERARRSFSEQNLRTEIEILPSFMEITSEESFMNVEELEDDEPTSSSPFLSSSETATSETQSFEYGGNVSTNQSLSRQLEQVQRWSEPTSWSLYHHLGNSLHGQEIEDRLFGRRVFILSPNPIPKLNEIELRAPTWSDQSRNHPFLLRIKQISSISPPLLGVNFFEYFWDDEAENPLLMRSQILGDPLNKVGGVPMIAKLKQGKGLLIWQLLLQVYLAHLQGVAHQAISPEALRFLNPSLLLLDRWELGWAHLELSGAFKQDQQSEWSAPELHPDYSGERIDPLKIDVFNLALIITRCLLPNMSTEAEQLASALPSILGSHPEIVVTLRSALSSDPKLRPSHAGTLITELSQCPPPDLPHEGALWSALLCPPTTGLWSILQ